VSDSIDAFVKQYVTDVPDFPKKGILFRDVSPLLCDPIAFETTIAVIDDYWGGRVDCIAALDARGFIFGSALALSMQLPLILIRKKGKLPGDDLITVQYALEYGDDCLQMHGKSVTMGDRVLLIDDLLATGGTMSAACSLVEKAGATVAGCAFIIELSELNGRTHKHLHTPSLDNYEIQSLAIY